MEITKTDIERIHHDNLVKLCAYRGIKIEPFEDFDRKKVFQWRASDGKEDYDIYHIKKSAEANKTAELAKIIAKCKGRAIICIQKKKSPVVPPNIEIIHSDVTLMHDFAARSAAVGTSVRVLPSSPNSDGLSHLAKFGVTKEDLPQIHISCPECIWLGAKVGDIIESIRVCKGPTNLTGDYRLVTDSPFR
jgi:DNA-directed RNA polymerase subunit H (RpoH/RPB5)